MAHPDLDALLNAVLPLTQELLSSYGEFYPVGASMSSDGHISLAASIGETDRPLSQDVIDGLVARFRLQASSGEIRACIICYDGRVEPPGHTGKTDAICAWLEHRSSQSIAVFLPYRKEASGALEYGGLFASALDGRVFNHASD